MTLPARQDVIATTREKPLGAQSATEVETAGNVSEGQLSHAAPQLPAAVQQIVDSVTDERRRYVASRSVNWCAYNPHGIRIAVIFPHPEGEWAVAGRYENPWANPHSPHPQPLRRFTLEAAKSDVQDRHPTMCLRWEAVEVEQAGHDFAPVEKAS